MHSCRSLVFLTVLLAAVIGALPASAARVDLSGQWQFRFDFDAKGEAAGWQNSSAPDGWMRIDVPGSFDQTLRNNLLYEGKGWYRRQFDLPAQADLGPGRTADRAGTFRGVDPKAGRVFLVFDGVAIRAKVWVNGHLAGQHLFPYTGFELDVTDLVKRDAPNTLVVLADNEILERAIPDKKWHGWWNYGGINRRVWLETRPSAYISEAVLATRTDGGGAWEVQAKVEVRNYGQAGEATYELRITGPRGRTVWTAAETRPLAAGLSEQAFVARIARGEPWSPESPRLYSLSVRLAAPAAGERVQRFGLRQIEVKGEQILLNGKPVVLRGMNLHEMYPGVGMTPTREQVRRDLEDIRALGGNMVRSTHYTHDHQFFELCDEMGLLVWTEIPAWQTRADVLGDDQVWEAYGAPQLREMVEQYRRHTSVIIWSVGNEFASDQPGAVQYVKRGCDLVRKLDPTRLVTFASSWHDRDKSFAAVDFIAMNEYFGWYYGNIQDLGPMLDRVHQRWPGKPIVVSEFGAGSLRGWTNPSPPDAGQDHTEDFQVKLLESHFEQMFAPSRRAFVSGAIVWVYADFPNPSAWRARNHPPLGTYTNLKGIVTEDREKKRAYFTVQKWFKAIKNSEFKMQN